MKINISIQFDNFTNDYTVNDEMNIKEALKIIYDCEGKVLPCAKYIFSTNKTNLCSLNFTFAQANIEDGDKLFFKGVSDVKN